MKRLLCKALALWDEFTAVNAETYASSIAYFAFLSLVPSLALCISLVSKTGISLQDVATILTNVIPDALEDLVMALVDDAFDRSDIAFSLSSLTLIWTASKGIKALRGGLNVTYGVKETRSIVTVIVISVAAAFVLGAMAAASIYLVFSDSVLNLIKQIAPDIQLIDTLSSAMNPFLMLACNVLILNLCYAYLPAGIRHFKTQLPGATLASLAMVVLSFGFRLYVDFFGNYTVLYGSIATVALLLIWMYLVSYIILIGGFINRMLAEGKLRG